MANKKKTRRKCDLCNVFCSSAVTLHEHVVGRKHLAKVKRDSAESPLDMYKLQYFLDTYLELEPLVGLECVEELQTGKGYDYRCLLCGFHGLRNVVFMHIIGERHMRKYLDTYHPELLVYTSSPYNSDSRLKMLQKASATYCNLHGRKKIIEIKESADLNDEFLIGQASPKKLCAAESTTHTYIKESLQYVDRRDNECQQRQQRWEFTDNGDFLDYLKTFKIQNDEDAQILKQIAQNCSQALARFQEEQNQPQGEIPGNPQGLANETDDGSPAVNLDNSVEKVAAALEMQMDATQLFFNSIKNMEQSEVVSTLHKISATNPAFRGINVPNVIKYLQETGCLKTS